MKSNIEQTIAPDRPSIRDVARMARVAPSTVSLVINNRGHVAQETRSRVEAAIRQLDYRPRTGGRVPRSTASAVRVAVVYTRRAAYYGDRPTRLAQEWIEGISEALDQAASRVQLTLVAGTNHFDEDPILPQMLEKKVIRGAILIGATKEDGYLDQLLQAGIPLIAMNRRPKYGEFGHVDIDNFGAGRQVIHYLVRLGHRRIAVMRGPSSGQPQEERWQGAQSALAAYGLKPVLAPHVELGIPDADMEAICRQMIDARVTALFAAGDEFGARCADMLARLGVSVPQQMSIIGYDDWGNAPSAGMNQRATSSMTSPRPIKTSRPH